MKQRITHGVEVNFVTPDEIVHLIPHPEERSRIRAEAQVQLNASGNGVVEVYTVPTGMAFEARRVTLFLGGATDPSTGNVPLNVAGKAVVYQRSGSPIEFAVPMSPNAVPQVPGVQTWGMEQGPYIRNAETFEVAVIGLTANAILSVILEGILTNPKEPRS